MIDVMVPRATWWRMADKAGREGLRAYRLNGDSRAWAVTSRSAEGTAYEVTILDGDILCSCRGSAFHPYCKHRALVLRELGLLSDDSSEQPILPERVVEALRAS